MDTMQAKTGINPKHNVFRFWFIRFVFLLGLPGLFYYGYCFGLWGRKVLLLQYLFQCNCPAFSEEWRYPTEVDIIVPACNKTGSRISPSGRLVLVYEKVEENGNILTYLLDTQTNKKNYFSLPESNIHFLNDRLMYIFVWYGGNYEGGDYIFDLATTTMYPIQKFISWRPGSFVNGYADLAKLSESLLNSDNVYYIRDGRLIVALPDDFPENPNQAFLSGASDIPYNGDINRVEPFLKEYNIDYTYIPAIFTDELMSPDSRFIARRDGIYLSKTNQMIVEGYTFSSYHRSYSGKFFSLRGWKYDSSGAIYSQFIGPCLLEFGFPGSDGPGCFVQVPQPVLLLKVPEEYLTPTP